MKYRHEVWPVSRLLDLYSEKKLNLNPPYQRNPIWSVAAQKELIESILKERPIPNFFLLEGKDGSFEVVDGKQRALAMLYFCRGELEVRDGITIDTRSPTGTPWVRKAVMSYPLNVTVIHELGEAESIHDFYALVNSTGLRLNRPEVRKAEFYHTNLLRLVTNLAALRDFQELGLFTRLSAQRMNDIDFVSELVTQIQFGVTDKKETVDELYESDITDEQFESLRAEFLRILRSICAWDAIVPLRRTRYCQKNDFYTLFGFLHLHPDLEQATLNHFYHVLLKVGPHIRPSQEHCEPLMTYAFNCVTQSNSKRARETRLAFFDALLLNRAATPNPLQRQILGFFKLDETAVARVGGYLTLRWEDVRDPDYPDQPELPNAPWA